LGYYNIVGEVVNNLSSNIKYVEIIATFYNAQNAVIGTYFTFTTIDIMAPGQKSPFGISSYPDNVTPARYDLSISRQVTTDQPASGLTILSQTPSYDNLGYYRIVGNVKNQLLSTANYVKLICTFYDSANKVMGVAYKIYRAFYQAVSISW
jgi:hypothetical protein